MIRKLLRAVELALLAVIGAAEWLVHWVERQGTAVKLGLGMLVGVAATDDSRRNLCMVAVMVLLVGSGSRG